MRNPSFKCDWCGTSLGITTFKKFATVKIDGRVFITHPSCKVKFEESWRKHGSAFKENRIQAERYLR